MRAFVALKPDRHQREFTQGLMALGYSVFYDEFKPEEGDVLVIWNRIHTQEKLAQKFESVGKVLVAENGYTGNNAIALSLGDHNGAGSYTQFNGLDRWMKFEQLDPIKIPGRDILVIGQKGIGSKLTAMPRGTPEKPEGWRDRVQKRLRELSDRPIRFHEPTKGKPDFYNVFCVVIWNSAWGIYALCRGHRVVYDANYWIGAAGGTHLNELLTEADFEGIHGAWPSRREAMVCVGMAQYTPDEIRQGIFGHLLK